MNRALHIAALSAFAAMLLPLTCRSADRHRNAAETAPTAATSGQPSRTATSGEQPTRTATGVRDKKKKKDTATQNLPQENVTRIRITMNLADLRDSIEAVWQRNQAELLDELSRGIDEENRKLIARIDAITGLGHGRPRSYKGDMLVSLAKEHLGKPYRWAANGPDVFDCSGFTKYVYKEIGVFLPRHSGDQYKVGRHIDVLTDLQEGDLVFFGKKNSIRTIGHVGIVVSVDREHGKFTFIHASSAGGVRISPNNDPYFYMRFIGGARFIGNGE